MTKFHNLKFAGIISPEEEDEVDLITLRKAKYLRFTNRMIGYPAKIDRRSEEMPTDKDQTIITSVKNGLLPWPHKSETPDEYIEKWRKKNKEAKESDSAFRQVESRPWGDYFYTCFFGLAGKLILMDEETMREKEAQLEQPVDVSGYPPDGSKGQARACRSNKRMTVKWFLGKWDGHYTEWEEHVTVGEQF